MGSRSGGTGRMARVLVRSRMSSGGVAGAGWATGAAHHWPGPSPSGSEVVRKKTYSICWLGDWQRAHQDTCTHPELANQCAVLSFGAYFLGARTSCQGLIPRAVL